MAPRKADNLCVQCARGHVDWPRSESQCVWCRLGSAPGFDRELAQTRRRLEHADLVAGYESGQSLEELAVEHGCSVSAASRRLRSAGVRLRSRGRVSGRALCPFDDDEAVRRYVDGRESLAALTARFGVAQATLRERLVAAGVEIRPRGRPKKVAA